MLYKDWKKYLRTLDKDTLSNLTNAFTVILDDKTIAKEFQGMVLLDLKYLGSTILSEKK